MVSSGPAHQSTPRPGPYVGCRAPACTGWMIVATVQPCRAAKTLCGGAACASIPQTGRTLAVVDRLSQRGRKTCTERSAPRRRQGVRLRLSTGRRPPRRRWVAGQAPGNRPRLRRALGRGHPLPTIGRHTRTKCCGRRCCGLRISGSTRQCKCLVRASFELVRADNDYCRGFGNSDVSVLRLRHIKTSDADRYMCVYAFIMCCLTCC